MAAVALVGMSMVAAALLLAGSKLRRASGIALLTSLFPLPFLLGPHAAPPLRFLLALLVAWSLVRGADLALEHPARPPAVRVWHIVTMFDSRHVRRAPPALDRALLLRSAAFAVLLVLMWRLVGGLAPPARWLVGGIGMYCGPEIVDPLVRAGYRTFGFHVPRMHDAPILARSVAEFWGLRWNKPVSQVLRARFFLPLARRGHAAAGLVAAFLASALLHAYLAWAGAGLAMGALMGLFFLVHGGAVALERALEVTRWPRALAHLWTLSVFLLTLPLFVEPMLRCLGL